MGAVTVNSKNINSLTKEKYQMKQAADDNVVAYCAGTPPTKPSIEPRFHQAVLKQKV
jgi:hypothetical protein